MSPPPAWRPGDLRNHELIRKLHRERALSILLVEHDMRVVFHLADESW